MLGRKLDYRTNIERECKLPAGAVPFAGERKSAFCCAECGNKVNRKQGAQSVFIRIGEMQAAICKECMYMEMEQCRARRKA